MNMKAHLLVTLRKQLESWEELPAGRSEEQITTPKFDSNWSIKDVISHL